MLREILSALEFAALLIAAGWLCHKLASTPIISALNEALTPEPRIHPTRK